MNRQIKDEFISAQRKVSVFWESFLFVLFCSCAACGFNRNSPPHFPHYMLCSSPEEEETTNQNTKFHCFHLLLSLSLLFSFLSQGQRDVRFVLLAWRTEKERGVPQFFDTNSNLINLYVHNNKYHLFE